MEQWLRKKEETCVKFGTKCKRRGKGKRGEELVVSLMKGGKLAACEDVPRRGGRSLFAPHK